METPVSACLEVQSTRASSSESCQCYDLHPDAHICGEVTAGRVLSLALLQSPLLVLLSSALWASIARMQGEAGIPSISRVLNTLVSGEKCVGTG